MRTAGVGWETMLSKLWSAYRAGREDGLIAGTRPRFPTTTPPSNLAQTSAKHFRTYSSERSVISAQVTLNRAHYTETEVQHIRKSAEGLVGVHHASIS